VYIAGSHRFSPTDAQKTFANLGVLWGQLTEGRDARAAAPVVSTLVTAFASTMGPAADLPPEAKVLTPMGERAAATLKAGQLDPDCVERLLEAVMSGLEDASSALRDAGQLPATMAGTVRHLHVSDGGVPKQPRTSVEIGFRGVIGDRQKTRFHHGRPWQALSIWSAEVIDALRAEGHPVSHGSTGENITVEGIAWAEVRAGVRLRIGTALAQVSVFALPCHKIAASFLDRDMNRIHHDRGPVSRVYATVLEPGGVSLGDAVVLEPER
jgi:MOSC domain-containing protein YiiM